MTLITTQSGLTFCPRAVPATSGDQYPRELGITRILLRQSPVGPGLVQLVQRKPCLGQGIEVRAQGAVIGANAVTNALAVGRPPEPFIEVAGEHLTGPSILQRGPLIVGCLEARVRNREHETTSGSEEAPHGVNGCLQVRDISQTMAAGDDIKGLIDQAKRLCVRMDVGDAQRLLRLVLARYLELRQ